MLVPLLTTAAATAAAALVAELGVKVAAELGVTSIASGVAAFVGQSAAFAVERARREVASAAAGEARKLAQAEAARKLKSWAAGVAVQAATVTMSQAREAAATAVVTLNESQVPVVLGRTWTTQHDEKVRPAHAAAEGQRQPFGAPFDVGGYQMRYPGDTLAPPALTANCRCRLRYSITKG